MNEENKSCLINFDGLSSTTNFWINLQQNESTELFPCGYTSFIEDKYGLPSFNQILRLEYLEKKSLKFDWEAYLQNTSSQSVPFELFTEEQKIGGMTSNYFKSNFKSQFKCLRNYSAKSDLVFLR